MQVILVRLVIPNYEPPFMAEKRVNIPTVQEKMILRGLFPIEEDGTMIQEVAYDFERDSVIARLEDDDRHSLADGVNGEKNYLLESKYKGWQEIKETPP